MWKNTLLHNISKVLKIPESSPVSTSTPKLTGFFLGPFFVLLSRFIEIHPVVLA